MNTTELPYAFIFVIIVVFVFFAVIFRGWFLLAVSFTPPFCGLHSGEQFINMCKSLGDHSQHLFTFKSCSLRSTDLNK